MLFSGLAALIGMAMDNKLTIFLGAGIGFAVGLFIYWNSKKKPLQQEENEQPEDQEEEEPVEYSRKSKRKVLLLGLEGAGKSSLIAALSKDNPELAPTKGFNVLNLKIRDADFEIWEIGGLAKPYWHNFFAGTDLLLFVMDATSNSGGISQAKAALKELLDHEMLRKSPFIIVANKQDLPNALPAAKVTDKLGLATSTKKRIPVVETSVSPEALKYGTFTFSELEKAIFQFA